MCLKYSQQNVFVFLSTNGGFVHFFVIRKGEGKKHIKLQIEIAIQFNLRH